MKNFKYLPILLLTAFLASCGGGGNNSLTGGGSGSGQSVASTLQIISSSLQLLSDQSGDNFVTISVVVRDQNNNVLEGETVLFNANSGSVEVQNGGVTSAAGIAEAFLKGFGNVANRTITVTASVPAAGISGQIQIAVVGTTLQVSGPSGVAQGDDATFNLVLTDGQDVGIAGQTIMLTSANGNTFDNPTPSTGPSGDVQVVLTADGTNTGDDVITATVLGLTVTTGLAVSNDVFAFTAPAAGTEVGLAPDLQTLTIQWQQGGNVPDGSDIELTADRGQLTSGSISTTGGIATVDIDSNFAGFSTITATGVSLGGVPIANGPTTQLSIEFVADNPDNVNVAAFPDNLITGEQATITAVVKDASGNRVKNVDVDFNITQDPSGGQLSVSSDKSDSQGVSTTTYTAGNSTTQNDGVTIRATVRNTAIFDEVNLTVTGQAINFVIGSGNDLFEVSPTRFGMPWSVTVTDVTGVPVAGEELRLTMKSTAYGKGVFVIDTLNDVWVKDPGNPAFCPDEDYVLNPPGNENGSLDVGEDDNGNFTLEAGNIATIVAATCEEVEDAPPGASQQTLQTDAAGAVELCVVYPQEYNQWVNVRLTATVQVDGGTENTESRFFQLPALADDISNTQASPPGQSSPFGTASTCGDPN